MKQIKPEIIIESSEMLKAIAHPVRINIMQQLYKHEELTVSELIEKLNLEQSLVSHNLRIMKDRGVLNVERKSKNAYYSLKHPKLYDIIECVADCCDV